MNAKTTHIVSAVAAAAAGIGAAMMGALGDLPNNWHQVVGIVAGVLIFAAVCIRAGEVALNTATTEAVSNVVVSPKEPKPQAPIEADLSDADVAKELP